MSQSFRAIYRISNKVSCSILIVLEIGRDIEFKLIWDDDGVNLEFTSSSQQLWRALSGGWQGGYVANCLKPLIFIHHFTKFNSAWVMYKFISYLGG